MACTWARQLQTPFCLPFVSVSHQRQCAEGKCLLVLVWHAARAALAAAVCLTRLSGCLTWLAVCLWLAVSPVCLWLAVSVCLSHLTGWLSHLAGWLSHLAGCLTWLAVISLNCLAVARRMLARWSIVQHAPLHLYHTSCRLLQLDLAGLQKSNVHSCGGLEV